MIHVIIVWYLSRRACYSSLSKPRPVAILFAYIVDSVCIKICLKKQQLCIRVVSHLMSLLLFYYLSSWLRARRLLRLKGETVLH